MPGVFVVAPLSYAAEGRLFCRCGFLRDLMPL